MILEHIIEQILEVLIPICELMGISVVAFSAVSGFIIYIHSLITHQESNVKSKLASGLALSLEFKMAAEILRTVIVRTWQEVAMLGAIVVLREILFFFINKDIKEHNRQHTEEISENKKITGIKFERE